MSIPYQRRRDPQPVSQGWEIAVAASAAAALWLILAALAGLGAASAMFGHGWVWPHGTSTIGQVIGGLLTGHPGKGLTPSQLDLVATPPQVYGCVAGCEAVAITLAAGAGVVIARYRRPNDARSGMATRREAERAVGVSQLRNASQIIRPDLYGKRAPLSRAARRSAAASTGRRPRTGFRAERTRR